MTHTIDRKSQIRHAVRHRSLNHLYELFFCTQYAIQHKCKIILEWMMYSATNLSDIFEINAEELVVTIKPFLNKLLSICSLVNLIDAQ